MALDLSALLNGADLSGLIAKLTSDPSVTSEISRLLSGSDTPPTRGEGKAHREPPPPPCAKSHRSALLSALRPYMSPSRQAAIDRILSLGGLGDLLAATAKGDAPTRE